LTIHEVCSATDNEERFLGLRISFAIFNIYPKDAITLLYCYAVHHVCQVFCIF